MEKIYKVVLRHDSNHKQARYFVNEKDADKVKEEFEKRYPCKFANKYVLFVE